MIGSKHNGYITVEHPCINKICMTGSVSLIGSSKQIGRSMCLKSNVIIFESGCDEYLNIFSRVSLDLNLRLLEGQTDLLNKILCTNIMYFYTRKRVTLNKTSPKLIFVYNS